MAIKTINGVKVACYEQACGVTTYGVQGLCDENYNKLYLGLCEMYNTVNQDHATLDLYKGYYRGYLACK